MRELKYTYFTNSNFVSVFYKLTLSKKKKKVIIRGWRLGRVYNVNELYFLRRLIFQRVFY